MRSVQTGLLVLLATAHGAFGARNPRPLRSFGRAVVTKDGWIQAESDSMPMGMTNMLKVELAQDDPIPAMPATSEAPPAGLAKAASPPAHATDLIKGITWSGSGCPKGAAEDAPSVTWLTNEEKDETMFWMTTFGVSLGLDGTYGPLQQSCALVFDVVDVPAGYRFGFMDSRAEGNIFLEKGSIANFTTDIWWGDKPDGKTISQTSAHNMKYWPNYDKDEPVNVRYMTTPYMLDTMTMQPYASSCAKSGETFSGKLTVQFTLTMTPVVANAAPQARGLVDMLAAGITTKVIPC